MTTKRKKSKQNGMCVYCGAVGPMTRDHVIPKVMFVELDPQMITVSACERCQLAKGRGEPDLRNYVNMEYAGARHPDAATQFQEIVSHSEPTRQWVRRSLAQAQPMPLVTESGIYLGEAMRVPFNGERMMRTVEYIVRGLYYHETGRMLPPSVPVEVRVSQWYEARQVVAEILGEPPYPSATTKGNRVCRWIPILLSGTPTPTASAWLIAFNDGVLFYAVTDADNVAQYAPSGIKILSPQTDPPAV